VAPDPGPSDTDRDVDPATNGTDSDPVVDDATLDAYNDGTVDDAEGDPIDNGVGSPGRAGAADPTDGPDAVDDPRWLNALELAIEEEPDEARATAEAADHSLPPPARR
jgi:hypothetical protein